MQAGTMTHLVSVRHRNPLPRLAKGVSPRALHKRVLGFADRYKNSAGIDVFDNTVSADRSILNDVLLRWMTERAIVEINKETEVA